MSSPYPVPSEPCMLTRTHTPAPLTREFHHIIPVAWQLFWQPAVTPFPGPDPDGRGMLWDSRGVWLCPTHHRSVHAYIVNRMRGNWPARIQSGPWELAGEALVRFLAVGGSLAALVAAGEWGES